MFGRIRASPSSLDTFEGSPPSKILKDDSFSIYEATLMKMKLGAKRDTSSMQMDEKEFTNDCSVTDESKMDVDCINPATTLMEKDCCSSVTATSTLTTVTSLCDSVCTENNVEQPRQSNVSILRFFKVKDHGPDTLLSMKNESCGSVSPSGSVESNVTTSELCE